MQSDRTGSAKRAVIHRPGLQSGASPKAAPAQKRQHALRSCLDLCESLGFHAPEEPTAPQDAGSVSTAQAVHQLVDAAERLLTMQSQTRISEDAACYGKLLQAPELSAMASTVPLLMTVLRYIC